MIVDGRGSIVATIVLFGLVTLMHLSLVSREIILAIVLFVLIVFGITLIVELHREFGLLFITR